MSAVNRNVVRDQVLPIVLTVVTFGALSILLFGQVAVLNMFTKDDIVFQLRWGDVLLGLTIYLKTSVDFAIFIARLMETNSGWKSRVAIELGTAVGNAAGTMAVLLLWAFFKEISWLLALMILLAALVLFRLAEDGIGHASEGSSGYPRWFRRCVESLAYVLAKINAVLNPVLKYIIPHVSMKGSAGLRFWPLFAFAFTIPFILGLDDFAGYVPVFNIVNVFGFAVGVFAGHTILNVLLYLSPARTVRAVKNPIISLLGSLAFIALAIWGLVEVVHLLH